MPDDTNDYEELDAFLGLGDPEPEGGGEIVEEEPSSYHSGRVRIIGAEPAGDSVPDATGPVVEEHPDLPHWNDAPTGQVPAILDRSSGEDQPVAPPTWREEENDWEAQEEIFEPAMLSDDLPAVARCSARGKRSTSSGRPGTSSPTTPWSSRRSREASPNRWSSSKRPSSRSSTSRQRRLPVSLWPAPRPRPPLRPPRD